MDAAAACADATITPIRDIVPAQDQTLAATTNSADTRIVAIHDIVPAEEMLQAMEERMLQAMEERMGKTTERLQGHISVMESKIHRFPRGLRGIGGQDDRYIVPSVVAFGPYHHGLEHLRDMEEVKHAAAHHLCMGSGHPVEVVFRKILSVAGDARRCYADAAVARLSDAEFAAMMFLDGCFLLQYMVDSNAPLFLGCTGPSILKDMMLLDYQIPWLVLETLAESMGVDVPLFIAAVPAMGDNNSDKFFPKKETEGLFLMRCRSVPPAIDLRSDRSNSSYKKYRPPHLLGLLRFSQICSMPGDELKYQAGGRSSLSSSAVKLAQMGVKLTASTATWFGDMNLKKKSVFGELSLSPLFLNDVTACWLVNMAALEASTASSWSSDGFVVGTYLSVLAMLMDREEDVHELRGRRVLDSLFSDTQTLAFFKGLGQHLRFGGRYFVILEQIGAYKRNRRVQIAALTARMFVYNHYGAIATTFSIIGVLVGIFKTLLSLKQH